MEIGASGSVRGAWAIDADLVLKEGDGLCPVGRVRADFEYVRTRFGDPAALPGGVIDLVTPVGRARISWDARAGMWIVAGDSIDVMPFVVVALTGSTVALAAGVAGKNGAAAEDAARKLTGAYAGFTALSYDGEGRGDDLGLMSQRESMADDLRMAVSGAGLAARLSGLVERWKRAQVSADAEEGVEVDYSEAIETARALAALAARA